MRVAQLFVAPYLCVNAGPAIQVALAPPASGGASKIISSFQRAEDDMEATAMNALQSAFDSELSKAQAQISSIVHSSFLQGANDEVFIRVKSGGAADMGKIGAIERVRGDMESHWLSQARFEFAELRELVMRELSDALHGRRSFLQVRDPLNLKVKASSTPWPSTFDMAAGLENRRDADESAVQSRILGMQIAFVRKLNEMIARAL